MSTKIQIGERVALQDIVNKNNRVRQAFLCRTGYTGFGKWKIELIENGNVSTLTDNCRSIASGIEVVKGGCTTF